MSGRDSNALPVRVSWAEVIGGPARHAFEARLPAYVAARRWFRGKSRAIARVVVSDHVDLVDDDAAIAVVRVSYVDAGVEDYVLPLAFCRGEEAAWIGEHAPHLVVCACSYGDGTVGLVCDGLGVVRFQRALLSLFEREAVLGDGASIRFRRIDGSWSGRGLEPRSMDAEQSNTSIVFGDRFIVKVTRKLEPGISADLEMGEFLTRAGYRHAPAVLAAAEIRRGDAGPGTLAIMNAFAPNRGDAWSVFLDFIARAIAAGGDVSDDQGRLLRTLACRVAELHRALASRDDLPAFRPEPIDDEERRALAARVRASLGSVLDALLARGDALPADARRSAREAASRREALEARVDAFASSRSRMVKTRIHGDLHLGQVLFTGDDFVLIDFEGEPARTLAERKAKRSPLADVAGMLRSFHYASAAAARASSRPDAAGAANRWFSVASAAFVSAYFDAVAGAAFVPPSGSPRATALDFYVLEKCVYEIQYELDNRPDWIVLPVLGLLRAVEDPG